MIYKNSAKALKPESTGSSIVTIPHDNATKGGHLSETEGKTNIYLAICATVAVVLLIFAVTDLVHYPSNVVAPPAPQASSVAMDTMTTRSPTPDIDTIYVASGNGGLKAYSLATSGLDTIYSTGVVNSVTYDFISNKIYWARAYDDGGIQSTFYRSDPTGKNVEMLFNTPEYGQIYGLAFDWIANVIYAVTFRGYVIACSVTPFRCVPIIREQLHMEGIAVDPIHGRIYWTEDSEDGSVFASGTDGSHPAQLIRNQDRPRDIVIDFEEWRLYWACQGDHLIRSSNMDGGDIRIIQLPQSSSPHGIAIWGDRIYWTNHFAFKLETIGKNGEGSLTLNTGSYHVYDLVILATKAPASNRTNNCAFADCHGVCVLTDVSFRCLD